MMLTKTAEAVGSAARPPVRNTLKKKAKKRIFIVCMLAWPLLHFGVFWLYVNFNTILMTFQKFNVITGTYEWYGLERFRQLWEKMILGQDPILHNSFINSLWVFPVQNFIILPLSFIFAYFLYKKVFLSGMFRVIFFLPSILSIVVLTMAFRFMFHTDFGPVSNLIDKVFHVKPDYFSSMSPTAMPMVFLFGVWAGLGYNIILLNGSISRIPQEVMEYARIDGVGIWREMFGIALPLTWPTLSTLFITGTTAIFGFFIQPMLLCGQGGGYMGKTSTVALQVVYLVQNGSGSDAAAIGLFFSVLGIPFILFIKWLMTRISPDVEY